VTVDPEGIDADDMSEALLGLMTLGTHPECAAIDERHPGGFAFFGWNTRVCGATSNLGRCRAPLLDTGCECADHDPCERQRNQRGEGRPQPT
jgi:hypothetical protein